VSGNVSLYNETDGIGIPPTPVVGGVGLIEDLDKVSTLKGAQPGDTLILIGETKGHLGASLYAREILGLDGEEAGPPPPVDLETEKRNADFVRSLIEQGLVNAVHDVSDGGIACAVAEMALASGVGVWVDAFCLPNEFAYLFGEQSGRFLISASQQQIDAWRDVPLVQDFFEEEVSVMSAETEASSEQVIFWPNDIGGFFKNNDEEISVVIQAIPPEPRETKLPLSRLREAHEGWLPTYMNKVD
ncbi:MAG: AIR synthase-related protein, partial [Pseudomonadota bacterium]